MVLAELDGEDLVVEAVFVLIVALPNNVIHSRVQILMHQFLLYSLTRSQLPAESRLLAVAVALCSDIQKLLLLLVLHLEVNLNKCYINSAPDIDWLVTAQ